jgi:hypothetical protein
LKVEKIKHGSKTFAACGDICGVDDTSSLACFHTTNDFVLQVISLLNDGGAKKDSYLSEMVSHVIADDCTQSEYSEAKELFELPVVTVSFVGNL